MRSILALAGKDIRLLLRDRTGAFFVLVFPLLFAIFFGVIFSGEGGETSAIPIALVDEDSSDGSRSFFAQLDSAKELDVLKTSREEAVALVQRGKRVAYIVLQRGFGAARDRMFWGDPAQIEIGLDPSRKAEASLLQGVLTGYYMQGIGAVFADPGKMRGSLQSAVKSIGNAPEAEQRFLEPLRGSLLKMDEFYARADSARQDSRRSAAYTGWNPRNYVPLQVQVSDVSVQRSGPHNPFDVTFPQAIIWAIIGCTASFVISLVSERSRGTLVRLLMAPLNERQILAGKGLACFLSVVGVSFLLLLFANVVFQVKPHSYSLLALAVVCAALCFAGIMMLLAVLGKTEASASGIGWAVLLVMAMIGGGMIPLFFMPSWMLALSSLSPIKWAVLAMEGAIWRGFTFGGMLFPCGILAGIGVVCFGLGSRLFARRGF
jgi:ABC-2 type transport system permease protein